MKITRSIYFIFILSIYLITACTQDTTPEATEDNDPYVAQGMYSASAGESLDSALRWPQIWNQINDQHDATPDELYWTEYGYDYYYRKEAKRDGAKVINEKKS